MLFTSGACLTSHCMKLHNCSRVAAGLRVTTVLHALHCRTACLQALHARAAAHKTVGSVLRSGWSSAMDNASIQRSAIPAWRCSSIGSTCSTGSDCYTYTRRLLTGQTKSHHPCQESRQSSIKKHAVEATQTSEIGAAAKLEQVPSRCPASSPVLSPVV
jgi:hypothetical protein